MDFDELVIKATAPFKNGCSWRLVLTGPHATTTPQRIEYGCYFGPFSMAGKAGELLTELKAMDDWDGNGCTVKLKPETVAAAMRRECKCCHAPIFTTKQSAPYEELFHGTLTQTSVYPREVLKAALEHNAGAVIFAHNHPSGHPEPSHADKILTTELKNALALIDVRVLDHIVVGGAETISFAERGLL